MVFQKGHKINVGKKHIKETIIKMKENRKGKGLHKGICYRKNKYPWNYIDGRSKKQVWFRYGSEWKNIRKAVLIRDDFTCQKCFRTNARLEVHHKIPFLLTKDNSLTNLQTLCGKCHREEKARIMKELKNQEIE